MQDTSKYIEESILQTQQKAAELQKLLEEAKAKTDHDLEVMVQTELETINQEIKELQESLETIAHSAQTDLKKTEVGIDINPNIATLEIRAGTGGLEAGLFASDLFNMYLRFAILQNWKTEEIFMSESEMGAIKTVALQIKGKNCYELLKNESGVHRVQRIPSTESGGRIHTSTATVAVLPEVKMTSIEIKPDDLKWDFFRSGGKGGQNVNKVSTAVRLTHIPTGLIVECQEERYQGKNREKALQMLESKIYTAMQEQQVKSITEIRTGQVGTGERSEKIRTYNFPQDRITDHRINQNFHNIPSILNGNISDVLEAMKQLNKVETSSSQ